MTSRERVLAALNHRQPDRVPVDFGGTTVSGMHISVVAALRDYYGLERRLVKVSETGQMLGLIEEDLAAVLGLDVTGVYPRNTGFGFPLADWKPWRMPDGLEILVPGRFNVTVAENGDTLMHPQGDLAVPPSARMPAGGYFFDAIIRQPEIDEDKLNPADNTEEYGYYSDADVAHFEAEVNRAVATGRAVMAKFGAGLGDIATIPGVSLKHPRGIRDITEWYMSVRTRRPYIHAMFERQVEVLLANLERVKHVPVDAVYLCGTDFGTQNSTFCSRQTFEELWQPYYRRINDWIHQNTPWKTFKHSCGSVVKFMDSFIAAGFDILNPVQISAAGMDPQTLKQTWGDRLTFWGGGVDTQHTLSFGKPEEVREQVLRHLEIFAPGGGYVFNTVHNVQAATPVANVAAMFAAIDEFNAR
jgi:uroporphyrinogen-III decarboxylase